MLKLSFFSPALVYERMPSELGKQHRELLSKEQKIMKEIHAAKRAGDTPAFEAKKTELKASSVARAALRAQAKK